MDIRVLRYYLAICQEGTMSRAAEVLHVTQPTLSRQIADLERELGCTLLERGSRHVTLTQKGLYLRRRAEEIVSLADQTAADLRADDDIIEGDIGIGAGESEGIRILAAQINAFRKRYPRVRFHIHSGNAGDVIERLERGLDDFAVLMSYADIDRFEHLRLPPTDAWGLLMPEGDPLAAKEHISPADLDGLPLIVSEQADRHNTLSTWFGRHGRTLDIVATYNLSYNAAMLVREGVGYVLGFDRLITTGQGTGLEFRLLYPPVISVIDVAWKRDVPLTPAAQRFMEDLTASFSA